MPLQTPTYLLSPRSPPQGDFLKAIPTPPTAAPPRHSQTAETLIAHPSKLPGDEPQPAHYPMLSLLQTLNEQARISPARTILRR